jgi:hypothetical protein
MDIDPQQLGTIGTSFWIIYTIIKIITSIPKALEAIEKTWAWYTRILDSLDDVPLLMPSNVVTIQLIGQSISASSGRLLGAVLTVRS